jgi:hypothetical protein
VKPLPKATCVLIFMSYTGLTTFILVRQFVPGLDELRPSCRPPGPDFSRSPNITLLSHNFHFILENLLVLFVALDYRHPILRTPHSLLYYYCTIVLRDCKPLELIFFQLI